MRGEGQSLGDKSLKGSSNFFDALPRVEIHDAYLVPLPDQNDRTKQ